MNIIKYEALLETIQCGSLTRAAEKLGYTQPGISHMILSLEKEFGFPLLIRRRDLVGPTEDAKQLLPSMSQIVQHEKILQEHVKRIHGVEEGRVRIGSFYSASLSILPRIIQGFGIQHPKISLDVYEGPTDEVHRMLFAGETDIAFVTAPVPENLDFFPLLRDRLLAVVPASDPLAKYEKLPVEAFATHPVITTFAKSDEDLYRVVDPAGIVPNIRYRIKNETTIISMVASQLGIAVMSELFLHNLPAGVAVRELDSTHNHRITGVALRSREETSPSTRKFLEYVRTCLGPFPGNAEKL